jgi:hypothetical protein
MKNICLYTAHSKNIGGGSVILKSLIEHLPEFDIVWKYSSKEPDADSIDDYLGKGLYSDSLIDDIRNKWLLLNQKPLKELDNLIDQLLKVDCDAYWVISHLEGLGVANELKKRQNNRPVYLTVHDDWAGALCNRSIRYRFMNKAANKMTIEVLKVVDNVDVISSGMKEYYQKMSGIVTEICHRYLSEESLRFFDELKERDENTIHVGHIGSIYATEDLVIFMNLLNQYGALNNKKIVLNMIGFGLQFKLPKHLSDMLVLHANMDEVNAIDILRKCDFVYCMYPKTDRLKVFGQTSFPTKVSAYVQNCRPIFGHGPKGCSIEDYFETTGTGLLWSSENQDDGIDLLSKIMAMNLNYSHWSKARDLYFGPHNLEVLRSRFKNII